MAQRRELALNLESVCPMYPTSPEQWGELYRNPAFLQILSDLKAEFLRLAHAAPSRDAEATLSDRWEAEGFRGAIKVIQLAEDKAMNRLDKDNRESGPKGE